MGRKPQANSITLDTALRKQGYEIRYHAANEEEIRVCCPFCVENGQTEDKKFRLGINMRTGQAHCFNCGWKTSDIYRLLQKATGVPVRVNDDYYESNTKKKTAPELPAEFIGLHTKESQESVIGRRAYNYLQRRGVFDLQIKRHNIGYCHSGHYGYRVVFPIYRRGKLLTFISRDFTGKQEPRFLNMPGEKPLYNVEALERAYRKGTRPWVVVYEGIFKVLAGECAVWGDKGLHELEPIVHVGTLGSHITELQLRDLKPDRIAGIVLFPDPNAAGLDGYLEAGHTLLGRGHVVAVASPFPEDEADEMEPEEVVKSIAFAKSFRAVSMRMAFEAAKRRTE